MSYSTNPFNPDQRYKGQVKSELKQADDNFNILAQAFKDNDPTTGIVKHALVADSCNNCGGSGSSDTIDLNQGVVFFNYSPSNIENTIKSLYFKNNLPSGEYYIQDTSPTYSNHGVIWYNTKDNCLYVVAKEGLLKIDWRTIVLQDIWYGLGKLKIENHTLKISNDGNNWTTVYATVITGMQLKNADDTKSEDDGKIGYICHSIDLNNSGNGQTFGRSGSSFTKTRLACVSPSQWRLQAYQHTNQNTAGWFGLHLGDIDISDGQGKMTSKGDNFDASNYSDISNAKFLPLGWFPVSGNDSTKTVFCDATITITPDNKISVSSKVSNPNDSKNYAYFSCSGTFPSSANHFGSFVLNGNLYSVPSYSIQRLRDSSIELTVWG